MGDAGWVIIVCLKDLDVLFHAILPLMFNVLMTCGAVTMELMLAAGWEIIVCLKELRALSFVTTLLQCRVRMERFLVTWEVLQRDAGWETTVILQDLNVPCLPLEINQMLVRNQNQNQ